MKHNIEIFGHKAYVVGQRVPQNEQSPELFYYGIRYNDTDFEPPTIEKLVIGNHWGTLVTAEALDFRGLDYIELNDTQKQLIIDLI